MLLYTTYLINGSLKVIYFNSYILDNLLSFKKHVLHVDLVLHDIIVTKRNKMKLGRMSEDRGELRQKIMEIIFKMERLRLVNETRGCCECLIAAGLLSISVSLS